MWRGDSDVIMTPGNAAQARATWGVWGAFSSVDGAFIGGLAWDLDSVEPIHNGDKVNKVGALTPSSKALFAREFCD
jgi:hypothetical protein